MKKKRTFWLWISIPAAVLIAAATFLLYIPHAGFGFAREVSREEALLRQQVIETAESWLGAKEKDGTISPSLTCTTATSPWLRAMK